LIATPPKLENPKFLVADTVVDVFKAFTVGGTALAGDNEINCFF